ncbi:CopL family metal-binding regulatory protein [Proteobacteria bacterium 005FR1]|nr:CopL family metal-binding regulatory protein [Proteobacteria bacterium 005FR1]
MVSRTDCCVTDTPGDKTDKPWLSIKRLLASAELFLAGATKSRLAVPSAWEIDVSLTVSALPELIRTVKSNRYNTPALILMLLLLVIQGAAASAMGHHAAVELTPPATVTEQAGDCHGEHAVPSYPVEQHATAHHDHADASADCCSADGDCSPGHCSATVALAQPHLSLSAWTSVHRSSLAVRQVNTPVYPLFRPPIP